MYQTLLLDSSFFALLLRFDEDLAGQVRQAGCAACGGALHSARYRRKPRGGPEGLGAEYGLRQSFCCAVEGCRRRATPPRGAASCARRGRTGAGSRRHAEAESPRRRCRRCCQCAGDVEPQAFHLSQPLPASSSSSAQPGARAPAAG